MNNGKKKITDNIAIMQKNIEIIERGNSKEIIVYSKNENLFWSNLCLFMGAISAILPFIVIYIAINNAVDIGFGIIISFIIFGYVSYFFLRRYFWNKYGKEFYMIEMDKFTYYYDYKYFRSTKYIADKVSVHIGFLTESSDSTEVINKIENIHNIEKEKMLKLVFNLSNGKAVESNIMTRAKFIQDVEESLSNTYK